MKNKRIKGLTLTRYFNQDVVCRDSYGKLLLRMKVIAVSKFCGKVTLVFEASHDIRIDRGEVDCARMAEKTSTCHTHVMS